MEAVFPNYTTYTYEGGTVMACTQEENGLKLTIQLPGGENRTISVPSSALLIQDGAKPPDRTSWPVPLCSGPLHRSRQKDSAIGMVAFQPQNRRGHSAAGG